MFPTLPPELLSQIAHELHGDKHALAAASSVSGNWLACFREALFRKIRACHRTDKHFKQVAQFLEDTSSVCPLIISLELRGDISRPVLGRIVSLLPRLSALFFKGSILKSSNTKKFPPFRLDYLSLYFEESWNDVISDDGNKDGAETIENKTESSLEEPTYNSEDLQDQGPRRVVDEGAHRDLIQVESKQESESDEDDSDEDSSDTDEEEETIGLEDAQLLSGVLSLFSHASKLIIEYEWNLDAWEFPPSNVQALIPTPGTLVVETFIFSQDETAGCIFSFFRRLLKMEALRSFAIGFSCYPDSQEWCSFLRNATNLSSIAFTIGENEFAEAPQLGLAECAVLESLTIQPEFGTENDDDDDDDSNGSVDSDHGLRAVWSWNVAQSVLAQNVSQIRYLTIAIGNWPVAPHHILQSLQSVDWLWFEDRLSRHYPKIESLTFLFDSKNNTKNRDVDSDHLKKFVETKLDKLASRGIIQVKDNQAALQEIYPWYNRDDSDSDDDLEKEHLDDEDEREEECDEEIDSNDSFDYESDMASNFGLSD